MSGFGTSYWLDDRADFLEVMKHIIKHTRCTVDKPILLILDNHESHFFDICAGFRKAKWNRNAQLPAPLFPQTTAAR
jgi:hypothetical protein